MFNAGSGPVPANGPGGFNQHAGPYDPYGFDDDGYGSGALYPGGPMGLKNKRAETDRECESQYFVVKLELTTSQPILWRPDRGSSRRPPLSLQRPTRMSIPPEKARGGRSSSS